MFRGALSSEKIMIFYSEMPNYPLILLSNIQNHDRLLIM